MINKKAQAEKGLTFPVLIILILVLGIYLVLASVISISSPAVFNTNNLDFLHTDDLLLKKVSINHQGKIKNLVILDALLLFDKKEIEKSDLVEGLKTLLTEKKNCIILAKDTSENPAGKTGAKANDDISIIFKDNDYVVGHIGNTPLIAGRYKRENLLSKAFIEKSNGEILYIDYYHGACVNE